MNASASANLAPGYFTHGSIGIVSSSHQDTAWMDTPDTCRRFRIEQCILPALELMATHPDYCFSMECTLHLMEFLEAHPERRDEVIRLTREGRLEWGATYNQPYESWLSGEELIRQIYYGRRWILKNLPGCDARVAFNPDVPARALQAQQIFAKSGVPFLFISRYHEGLYRWLSPDGTGPLVYSVAHYGNHIKFLTGEPNAALAAISRKLHSEASYYESRNIPPTSCLVNTFDFSEPKNFNHLISLWNGEGRPAMRYMPFARFFENIAADPTGLDTLMGERPDCWLYIHGPTHHWASTARREAARLLPAAEVFSTAACLLQGGFQSYPTEAFDAAWKAELYTDHGIGGKNGHITDRIFQHTTEQAREAARQLLESAFRSIAPRIQTPPEKGTPVTVFNTTSWQRSGPATIRIPASISGPVRLVDADGRPVPSQWSAVDTATETNVALASFGATAWASSEQSAGTNVAQVLVPRTSAEPEPEWISATEPSPHWLVVDLGQPRHIHRVVVRHHGGLGIFEQETIFNTAAFSVQGTNDASGPWQDLVPPISGNIVALTSHTFKPRPLRYLRILIHNATAPEGDGIARILEIQAFEASSTADRCLVFHAEEVPSLGYKTYYLQPGEMPFAETAMTSGETCENIFYRIQFAPGGLRSIFDKELGRELLDTRKLFGAEVFTLLSVASANRHDGTDAGEFGSAPLPVIDETFDRIAHHAPSWNILEHGPVRSVYGLEHPWGDTRLQQRIVVWHASKRIDCHIELLDFNGRFWREFRLALPLAMEKPTIAYEVPMGVVEIGKDEISTTGGFSYEKSDKQPVIYFEPSREIHPREVQNFITASDASGAVTLTTDVAVFDWQFPGAGPEAKPVLQPVLLATRRSCNPEGNWYPQAGNHTFHFSLTSHSRDWRKGWKPGIQANHPFQTVLGNQPLPDASLPESLSFFSTSADHVLISTVKKSEDDEATVVRCYDIEGRDAKVAIRGFRPVQHAEVTDMIEQEGSPAPVDSNGHVVVTIGHYAIETLKLRFQASAATSKKISR